MAQLRPLTSVFPGVSWCKENLDKAGIRLSTHPLIHLFIDVADVLSTLSVSEVLGTQA